jgi:hypothetical protein
MATSQRIRPSRRIAPGPHYDEWITAPIVKFLVLSWPARLACVCAVGLSGAVLLLAGRSLAGFSSSGHVSNSGMSNSAGERAQLFVQAWIEHDASAMTKFVSPADASRLQHWIAATPVPPAVSALPPAGRKIKTIAVEKDDGDGAVVSVRISSLADGGHSKSKELLVQKQAWNFATGSWQFVPETPETELPQQPVARSRINLATPTAAIGNRDEEESPQGRPASRNVVVPSNVPPWQRAR